LSKDTVDALRKKVEGRVKKVETHRSGQKPGWELEVDKLVACKSSSFPNRNVERTIVCGTELTVVANDADNTSIANLLSRRIFIKACMWHELAVVFHSRQAAQTTLGWRAWTKSQEEAHKALGSVWEDLGEQLKTMPIE
jgi:sorting nexin-8